MIADTSGCLVDTTHDEDECPECGSKTRCYECASQGGWISKAEQDALDRDEDRAGLIIDQIERVEVV